MKPGGSFIEPPGILFRCDSYDMTGVWQRCLLLLSVQLNKFLIKQKIQNADVQDALLIIPAFTNIMLHNHFREGIATVRNRC